MTASSPSLTSSKTFFPVPPKTPFIVIEGIDGAGKSSLAAALSTGLLKKSWSTGEPTANQLGKRVRMLLRKPLPPSPQVTTAAKKREAQLLPLYFADRFLHTKTIKRHLSAERSVLCCRYDLSTYAYQMKSAADLESFYRRHAYHRQKTLIPSLTLFLEIAPSTAVARLKQRGGRRELFEERRRLAALRENYLRAIAFLQKKDGRKILCLSAEKPLSRLLKETEQLLRYELASAS